MKRKMLLLLVAIMAIVTPLSAKVNAGDIFLRASYSPYTIGYYDFYNGHDIEGAKALTISKYGTSGSLEAGFGITNHLSTYLGGSFTFIEKSETVIENAHAIYHISGVMGFDIRLFSIGSVDFILGGFGGTLMNINANYFNLSTCLGGRVKIGWQINESINFALQSSVNTSFHNDDDPLYKSMTYLFDTASISLEVKL